MTTRWFRPEDLITVVSGVVVSPRHTDAIYDVVDFVTGEPHMRHQLPRATREVVGPELVRQHPWLADAETGQVGSEADAVTYAAWTAERYGEWHEVEALPEGAYVGREPFAEFHEMNPTAIILGDAPNDLGGGAPALTEPESATAVATMAPAAQGLVDEFGKLAESMRWFGAQYMAAMRGTSVHRELLRGPRRPGEKRVDHMRRRRELAYLRRRVTRPRVDVLTAQDRYDRIARALAPIHAPITDDELARRIETGEAYWREQRAWDEVAGMRYLLGVERDE